jgi:carbon starvation protein
LFILTTLDAGTRVGRYLLQGVLGRVWRPLGDAKNHFAAPVAAVLMVGGWGYFLIQGVRDPLGGINSLWPLFGIANQMLAAMALCLGTTIILKMALGNTPPNPGAEAHPPRRSPALALVTLIPLIWLLAVTFSAGVEKIFSHDPRVGFLQIADDWNRKLAPLLEAQNLAAANHDEPGVATARRAIADGRRQQFNNRLDAAVAAAFMALVAVIVFVSVREWILLLSRRQPVVLRETEPAWLPDYALKETGPDLRSAAGAAAIALGLVKELSGESHFERAREQVCVCACEPRTDRQIYVQATEDKFDGVRRCC